MPDEAVPQVAGDPVRSRAGGERLLDLVRVMQRLRGPGGCPWDAQQTHQTLGRHLLEEAHETLEAIDSGDVPLLQEELGDVLLQVVFHAEIARQAGEFDVDDVAEDIVAKLIRRHPHVFGDLEVDSADQVLLNWERIKAEEKGEHAVDERIPPTLPALARAAKVQRRAAGRGFEPPDRASALRAFRERAASLAAVGDGAPEQAIGEVLFTLVAYARAAGVDAESALRQATRAFSDDLERGRAEATTGGEDPSTSGGG